MKKIIMLAMVIGLMFIGATNINPKLSFRDIHLGMLRVDAQELATKYARESKLNFYINLETNDSHSVWLIQISTCIDDDEAMLSLKDATLKKYGKPSGSEKVAYKNTFGATLEGFRAWWWIGKDLVSLDYTPLVQGAVLRIMSSGYLESIKKGEMKF